MNTSNYAILGVLIASFIGGFGALFFKMAADKLRFNFWKIIRNKWLLAGVCAYGISTIIFIIALKYGELSVLYPLVSMTYIWVILFSIKFLNEKINSRKLIGIFFILAGIALLGLGS
jgi:drug/metabolite transporter (DMT)-like permease